jgi:hypothetical protein
MTEEPLEVGACKAIVSHITHILEDLELNECMCPPHKQATPVDDG